MARKTNKASEADETNDIGGGFSKLLEEALDNFQNPAWLGEHSALASPYFLGKYLLQFPRQEAEQPKGRGKALQHLLRHSAEILAEREAIKETERKRLYEVIKLYYFDDLPVPAIEPIIGYGRARIYQLIPKALQLLEEILVNELHPTLRLESQVPPKGFVGRQDLVTQCLAALRQRQSVALNGPAGIGKTALAAHLIAQMAPQPTFWYTFHTGINDRLNALLFSLAYFLQQHGAPQVWLQLVADEGRLKQDIVRSQLRHALQDLQKADNTSPILCFDEVDLLDSAIEEHALIIDFLNSLSVEIPLLLVGQRVGIDANIYPELPELPLSDIREMLITNNIQLSIDELTRLQEYTRGNPRLLVLFIALHRVGETLPTVLAEMVKAPSLEVLLNRVLRKLEDREQLLLIELSVYHLPAPIDRWADSKDRFFLDRLVELQLVQGDGQGGVSLLPAYREAIYASLPPEQREVLHLAAAQASADRTEYTASAHHLVQAHLPESAIHLWYPHMDTEINQGQAERALIVFNGISSAQLLPDAQSALKEICGRLELHRGNYGAARDDLKAVLSNKNLFSIRAYHMLGDIAQAIGELDVARIAYLEGQGTVNILLEREAIRSILDLVWIDRLEKKFGNAWRGTEMAEYELEHLRGEIMRDQGKLERAKEYYLKALALAKDLGNANGEAKTSNSLAAIFAQQDQFEVANGYWEAAYKLFEHIGRLSAMGSPRVNQAIGFFLAKKFEESIPLAEEALSIFDRFQEPRGQASAANTLAEAYFALGNLEKAEQYIGRVLETEEEGIIADTLRLYAELELQRKNYPAAKQHADSAIKMAQDDSNPYIEGYAYRVLGKVYLAQNDCAWARQPLFAAIDIFTTMDLPHEAEATRKIWDDSDCSAEK